MKTKLYLWVMNETNTHPIDGKFVNAGNGIFGEVLNVWTDGGDYDNNVQTFADIKTHTGTVVSVSPKRCKVITWQDYLDCIELTA
tara:strand:+ start:177 stop:431 length:255 start_codon:yes stop_codon:yes gene_type:complete